MKLATFAAGCFWGVEERFLQSGLAVATRVGYIGGHTSHPTYHQVCTGNTGHAEAVQVSYDPDRTSYQALLNLFWKSHDPTQLNKQGPDIGEQYRSVIFYHDSQQRQEAEQSKEQESRRYKRPIVTQIIPADEFYPAEEYHQKYLQKTGQHCSIIK